MEGTRAHVGLSEYAQVELGEIIAVELPDAGDELERQEPFGELESVKTVSELAAPVSGTVTATNPDLEDHPTIVNEDLYHEGWLIEIELSNVEEVEASWIPTSTKSLLLTRKGESDGVLLGQTYGSSPSAVWITSALYCCAAKGSVRASSFSSSAR